MISVLAIGQDYTSPNRKEFLIDSASDLDQLPTSTKEGTIPDAPGLCDAGSVAYTPDLAHIYLLGNDDAWHEV